MSWAIVRRRGLLVSCCALFACSKAEPRTGDGPTSPEAPSLLDGTTPDARQIAEGGGDGGSARRTRDLADVTAIEVTGEEGAYSFAVTVRSPDTGCDAYADFWEVVSAEGRLVYRRILAHSHVTEQPFTRSGGPVDAMVSQKLVVRAHMSVGGYGGAALVGSVGDGFRAEATDATFAADLESAAPQPEGCAF